jgi:hypothetical protein
MIRCAVVLGCLLLPAPVPAKEPAAVRGLAVHEWGVFRASEDAEFANADLRAEWDKLPEFVYGHIKGRVVPQHWGAVEVRLRPLIFFHAEQPQLARVTVRFPGGQAGVWYPGTEVPAVEGRQRQPKVGDTLVWNVGIKQCPQGWQPRTPTPLPVAEGNWFTRARRVKSDDVFARFGPAPGDVEREQFLYYDGIFPQGKWLKFDVTKGTVSLTSRVKHTVYDVTVIDRRGERPRGARVAKVEAGATVKELTFAESDPSCFVSEAGETLLKQLTGAGLNEDEARLLVDLWSKEMFETPGLCAFYRIPQEEYDARMPLAVTPQPEKVVRVGLIYHGHLEPDFAGRIVELVKQLDAPKFAERDAAAKKLVAIGPAALVHLQKLRTRKDLSIEVRERIDVLIKKWSAREALAP